MLRRFAMALAGAALALPAAAQAQVAWQPCDSPPGFECGKLDVPLDHSGSVPGTLTLQAARVISAANTTRTAVVPIAGGPGQAALPLVRDFAAVLSPAITTRDLLVFDQRGTGASDSLDCGALHSSGPILLIAATCAEQLGPGRAFFRTADSVADLEQLRQQAGYDKLVLYGVSYGTKVALAYAAAYPDHVERLVLDSVVPQDGPDPLRRSSLRAVPRVLGELCASGACRNISPSIRSDLRAMAARLRRNAISGSVFDDRGERFTARLSESGLYDLLQAGDLNPALRAELPGALRDALRGDRQPLLRLSANGVGLADRAQVGSAEADSDALFLTTTCEETVFPWPRGASIRDRSTIAIAAAKALPASDRGGFSYRVALDGPITYCLGWPTASPAPAPPGVLPTVPTLILDGRADLRTPIENAEAVAAQIPGSVVVPIPHTGHSVLGSDLGTCAQDAVTAFFAGQPVRQCSGEPNRFGPSPRPPHSISTIAAYGHTGGLPGRTLQALRLTVNDAYRQVVGRTLGTGDRPAGVGGLRGGYVRTTATGITFVRMEYVPGVRVSGELPDRGTATFTVSGARAARGSVQVTEDGQVSGRLGGRSVSAKFAVSAIAAPRISLRRAAAVGRFVHAIG